MATPIASEVKILKTKAAAKKGLGVTPGEIESVWPKPEFGPSMQIDNITKSGKEADEFIIPAGSIFPLGCAIPHNMVLQYGAYFPPGTMVSFDNHLPTPIASFGIDSAYFPDGVLVPIHARMVSVQPLQTIKPAAATPEAVCVVI